MAHSLSRALLLFQQSRFDLAEKEVRRVLDDSPHDPTAHALLSMCLSKQYKLDEAQAEADQAIALAPDWAYTHSCRSVVMEHRRRYAEAEASAREAVRLDPQDADYHARLAATLFAQDKWRDAHDAAMEGLAHDADHEACGHLRTMALTKMGRQVDAVEFVNSLLARAPDDAMAHANKGWALLHQSKPREALEHFREALRIRPTYAYAQQGIVEALKARNPIYRWMLMYFLWMARLSNTARWGVIIGGYLAARALASAARANPAIAPVVLPFIILYVIFVVLTWFAYPFFNLLLRFNKYGWYALNGDQRAASNWLAACLGVFVVAIVMRLAWGFPLGLLVAGFAVGMALPLVTRYQCDVGWPRQAMTWFALGMAGVGLCAIAFTAVEHTSAGTVTTIFALGFVATPWVANYLVSATATR